MSASSTWTPVADWLPDSPRDVLVSDLEIVVIGSYMDGQWMNTDSEEFDSVITHWQELPEPPEC